MYFSLFYFVWHRIVSFSKLPFFPLSQKVKVYWTLPGWEGYQDINPNNSCNYFLLITIFILSICLSLPFLLFWHRIISFLKLPFFPHSKKVGGFFTLLFRGRKDFRTITPIACVFFSLKIIANLILSISLPFLLSGIEPFLS